MIAVIAHKKKHFDEWVSWMPPEDRKSFRLVLSAEQIRGMRFTDVIRIGPYWHIHNVDELYKFALISTKVYSKQSHN